MLGAIAGDIIGSVYERRCAPDDFPLFVAASRFTDDSVLTLATADAIRSDTPFADAYWSFGRRYPHAGYGGAFRNWLRSDDRKPYNSWGNGSAMRVSPVAWAFDTEREVLDTAERSAAPTHNHPEGILGAQAVALSVFLARRGRSKDDIRSAITSLGYDLSRSLDEIRPTYRFDVSCRGSVPEAITAFLESNSVETAIRLAISLGGDADTQAAIAGSIAEASYGGVPEPIAREALSRLPHDLRQVYDAFVTSL